MKTPTIIVRLVGIYLLAQCAIALLQAGKIQAIAGALSQTPNPMLQDMKLYASIGLVVGAVATAVAGPIARVLTFDSDPGEKSTDSPDELLRR